MFSLREHSYQALRMEPVEVDAGGGRGYLGEHRKLCARSCAAVYQRVEHAGASGFANGGSDFGDGSVGMVFGIRGDIHSLMVDEVFL
jgi:hypothetical protein